MKTETNKNTGQKSKLARAFTLVEIMLIVIFIGILVVLAVPRTSGEPPQSAREIAATADIKGLASALDEYDMDTGAYPNSLQDLLTAPTNSTTHWHGPYLSPAVLPIDPWGNPYLYVYPGKHTNVSYDLWSAGPDGKSGNADDIGNWQP